MSISSKILFGIGHMEKFGIQKTFLVLLNTNHLEISCNGYIHIAQFGNLF